MRADRSAHVARAGSRRRPRAPAPGGTGSRCAAAARRRAPLDAASTSCLRTRPPRPVPVDVRQVHAVLGRDARDDRGVVGAANAGIEGEGKLACRQRRSLRRVKRPAWRRRPRAGRCGSPGLAPGRSAPARSRPRPSSPPSRGSRPASGRRRRDVRDDLVGVDLAERLVGLDRSPTRPPADDGPSTTETPSWGIVLDVSSRGGHGRHRGCARRSAARPARAAG